MVASPVTLLRKPLWQDTRLIFGAYALIAGIASVKAVFVFGSNNYSIFYYSLRHLLAGKSLYALYPAEYSDHYHYAPTFAALFVPLFALPYKLGLALWPFLFAGVWVYAVYRLPLTPRQRAVAYWFCLQEMLTALVNTQTNPLIAALSIATFLSFEQRRPGWAAFFIILGFNVKIYSLVAGGLFLLYDQKGRFLAYCVLWAVVMALLPLLLTSPERLWQQYVWWVEQLMVKSDSDKWTNTSIHRLTHLFISSNISTAVIIGVGVTLFCTVYVHIRRFEDATFRWLMLASVLIFQVIFNPVAESPTYITAVTGVLCWWFVSPQTRLDWALLLSCFVLTVLSPSDFFPTVLRKQLTQPYALKALPCVLIWFRILWLMHVPAHVGQVEKVYDV